MTEQGKIFTGVIVFLLIFLKCCDSLNYIKKMDHECKMEEIRLKYTLEGK